jgi:hypothetical protein
LQDQSAKEVKMHNHAKQENIPTPAKLADNLIGSLGGLTAVDRTELRRQVAMLINHSYALGYAAGSGMGLVGRMRSRLSRVRRGAGQDIKLALSAIRERLTMIFSDHKPRSRKMLAPAFIIQYPQGQYPQGQYPQGQYPMRGGMMAAGDSVKSFQLNRPAALLPPAADWPPQNQKKQPRAGSPDQSLPNAREGAPSQFRVTQDLGRVAAIPRQPLRSEAA